MSTSALKKVVPVLVDTKPEILEKLGDLSGFRIAQNEVLLAIYMRPNTTASGFILTDKSLQEDRYQGKCGLVVKIGESCEFERVDKATGRTYGIPVKLHDWVVTRTSDTWAFDLNTDLTALGIKDFVPCRLVYEDAIRAIVDHPGMVY